jgi:hypothetical protein
MDAALKVTLLDLVVGAFFEPRRLSPHDVVMGGHTSWYVDARERLRRAMEAHPPRDRRWDDLDLSGFESGVREIHRVSRAAGSELVLLTQPTLYRVDLNERERGLLWMMGNYTLRSKRERMDRINDRIRALGEELGVAVVDLDGRLPRTTEVFYDDCHFNVRGAQLVAEEVVRHFADLLGLPQG